jgi:hypothetical protein
METKERDYKEERFEFTIYVNDNIICKRNFRIYNFIENSMNTLEFKEKLDEIVHLIDDDLKSKSRVYSWYYFNPQSPDDNEEFTSPLIEPWACTFKIVISDNKRDVITKIWDGYAYPKYIRDKVDLSNKNVKVTNKDGQTFSYEKEAFFKANEGRLSFEQEMLKGMIMDKPDVLLQITKKICEVCSPSKDEIKEKGYFDPKENAKYLSKYTVIDDYGKAENGQNKKYCYSIRMANKKREKNWERAVMQKTNKYFKTLY